MSVDSAREWVPAKSWVVTAMRTPEPDLPDTWVVSACDDCGESWVLDADEHHPNLTLWDARDLLIPELLRHVCPLRKRRRSA